MVGGKHGGAGGTGMRRAGPAWSSLPERPEFSPCTRMWMSRRVRPARPSQKGHGMRQSKRGAVDPFIVMDVMEAARLAEVAGRRIVHMEVGQPGTPAPALARSALARAMEEGALGYTVARYKLAEFVMSAAIAGLAGSVKSLVFQFATLTDAHWHTSGEVVLMTLLGGLGTVFGPLVGAAIVVILQNTLADKVGSMITVIIGSIFVLCVLLFRRGVAGELAALYKNVIGGREGQTQRPREGWTGSAVTSTTTVPTQAKR